MKDFRKGDKVWDVRYGNVVNLMDGEPDKSEQYFNDMMGNPIEKLDKLQGVGMLQIRVKKSKDINDAVDELACALDLARMYLKNPDYKVDDTVLQIIDDALDYCEETNNQLQEMIKNEMGK